MNIKLIYIVITLFTVANHVKSANILFVTVIPSHSHQVMFQPVWKELSLRGHNVTVITPSPLNDSTLTNLTEIDISDFFIAAKSFNSECMLSKPSFLTVFKKYIFVSNTYNLLGDLIFQHKNVQTFLKEQHEFHVVIVEWMFSTFGAFATKYQAPLIGITSFGASIPSLDTLGNPSHPIVAPDHTLPLTKDMTFQERLLSGFWSAYVRLIHNFVVLPKNDELVKKYLGQDMPHLGDIERNISLLLLNRNPVFHNIMPVVPAVIELGYIKLNKTSQKLDTELQNFLDSSKNGVIYFSLGSNVQAKCLPKKTLNAIFNTFRNIPYTVVFKGENDTFDALPKNVLFRSWLPQNKLLSHPNVKLFIMQGGLQSSEEAIVNEVPIIGIPFHDDQTANTDTMEKYGMGKRLEIEELTEEKMTYMIKEIISNPSYKTNVENLAKLFVDYPQDGLEKAVWWIEYVIRHKGAHHLRSSALNIPLYQYYLLDVIVFIFVTLFLLIFTCYIFLKVVYNIGKRIYLMCQIKQQRKLIKNE